MSSIPSKNQSQGSFEHAWGRGSEKDLQRVALCLRRCDSSITTGVKLYSKILNESRGGGGELL